MKLLLHMYMYVHFRFIKIHTGYALSFKCFFSLLLFVLMSVIHTAYMYQCIIYMFHLLVLFVYYLCLIILCSTHNYVHVYCSCHLCERVQSYICMYNYCTLINH